VTTSQGIASALNERGIPTARGNAKWQASQVRRDWRLALPGAASPTCRGRGLGRELFRSVMLGVLNLVVRLPTLATQLAVRVEVIVALVGRNAILAVRTLLREVQAGAGRRAVTHERPIYPRPAPYRSTD